MTRHFACFGLTLVALSTLAASANAQDRATRIRNAIAAYDNFETEQAMRQLQTALNPALGAPDSLWFRGAQLLVQIFDDEGQTGLVDVWARWAARLAPEQPLDTLSFTSAVVDAFRQARAAQASEPVSGDVVETDWTWPGTPPTGMAAGQLRVLAGSGVTGMRVLVVGRGLVTPGQTLTLPPGAYAVEASAEGFRSVRFTREVLPGVTTQLTVTLESAAVAAATELPDDVRTGALARFVRLSVDRFGTDPACAAGVLAGRDGLVLTSYRAIRGARGVTVTLASGQEITQGVVVLAHDVEADLAALAMPVLRRDSLPLATSVTDDQYLWTVAAPSCGTPATERLQVTGRTGGTLALSDSVAPPETGMLIDAAGAIAGVPVGPRRAAPPDRIAAVLRTARQAATGGTSRPVLEIARVESHAYGAVELSADVSGAVATVTPITWDWPELARTAMLPFRYGGPQGDYRLEVSVGGVRQAQQQFTIRPGIIDQLAVQLRDAQAAPGQVAEADQDGGGGFPWIIAVLGAGGAGAAALLVGGGGGGGGNGDGDTGTLTVRVPNN